MTNNRKGQVIPVWAECPFKDRLPPKVEPRLWYLASTGHWLFDLYDQGRMRGETLVVEEEGRDLDYDTHVVPMLQRMELK